jgi:hypothetical protein
MTADTVHSTHLGGNADLVHVEHGRLQGGWCSNL